MNLVLVATIVGWNWSLLKFSFTDIHKKNIIVTLTRAGRMRASSLRYYMFRVFTKFCVKIYSLKTYLASLLELQPFFWWMPPDRDVLHDHQDKPWAWKGLILPLLTKPWLHLFLIVWLEPSILQPHSDQSLDPYFLLMELQEFLDSLAPACGWVSELFLDLVLVFECLLSSKVFYVWSKALFYALRCQSFGLECLYLGNSV